MIENSSTAPSQRLDADRPSWVTAQGDGSGVVIYRSPLAIRQPVV